MIDRIAKAVFFFFYTLVYLGGLLVLLPRELLRRSSPLRREWLRERLGLIPSSGPGSGRRVWVHAVSVGEAMAARPLVEALRGGWDVALSTVTDTGRKVASGFMKPRELLFYLPFDLPLSVLAVLRRLRPDLMVVMETEIWPSLLMLPPRRGVKVVMANGRISEGSYRNYRRIRPLIGWFLSGVTHFCMQTEGDAERIINLGAPPERVTVTGNLKFGLKRPGEIPRWAKSLGNPLIIAGSTHEGEERLVMDVFRRLRKDFPGLRMVVAPRHPERFDEVERLLLDSGLAYARRTVNPAMNEAEVVLLDTVGELGGLYGAGDICVVGGSFVPKGGHNLFEPASWGRAVVCGPHMNNFPLSEEFFREGGAIRSGPEELEGVLRELLSDSALRERTGLKALELYRANEGALEKTLQVIEGLFRESSPLQGGHDRS
jgi:3-deoxy-D-manno-octulosonic-acid transferase